MINLDYSAAYQYKKDEEAQLKALKTKYGHHYQNTYGQSKKRVWYDGEVKSTAIKHEIIKHLLLATRFRCVYCMKLLARSEKPVDHFINNAAHPKFSFHPLNLVASCGFCNSSLKGSYEVLDTKGAKYHDHVFKIVHPIIHDVDTQSVFLDATKKTIDYNACSIEGKETIRLFDLLSLEMSIERLNRYTMETFFPIDDTTLLQLVVDTATYKPK